jgi:hypothetical protein
MKKLVIGLSVVLAGIAALGLAIVPGMTHMASAQSQTAGANAQQGSASASAASTFGGAAGSAAGEIGACPNFAALSGSCSETSGP